MEFVKLEVISSGQDTDSDATMRLEYYRALSQLGAAIGLCNKCASNMPNTIQRDYLRCISMIHSQR